MEDSRRGALAVLLALASALVFVTASALTAPLAAAQAAPAELPAAVHIPANAAGRGPLRVLLAVHGMGDNGASFSAPLISLAEWYGWVLVAPTMPYRANWLDPEQVRADEAELLPRLKATIERLPTRTGLPLAGRALCYGFSRGGQICQRFSLAYPQSVLSSASLSAGTYTLPYGQMTIGTTLTTLRFPYGTSDLDQVTGRPVDYAALRSVSFLIGVGERDNNPNDVPRQWDPYLGTNRVDRAINLSRALQVVGARCALSIFPGLAHDQTDEVRRRAFEHLAAAS